MSKMLTSVHSYELAFCGYSGSGKTTIITQLIAKLSKDFSIGYLKHDAHKFEMDTEGKDTYNAKQAGASSVYINSQNGTALLKDSSFSDFDLSENFVDNDILFIEGYKNSKIPKVLVLGQGESHTKLITQYHSDDFENVVAIIGRDENYNGLNIPYFRADAIDDIKEFILNYFEAKQKALPLYGLVLSGGRSTRMGTDKGKLNYHGVDQTQYLADQLATVCDDVFVSCRNDQVKEDHISRHKIIEDAFSGIGPLGGILTAMTKYPHARWFVVACDLPFFSNEDMLYLVKEADRYKVATSFLNPEKKWAEPLCTIYEPKAYSKFCKVLGLRKTCPRKALLNSNIKVVEPLFENTVDNANTPEDYKMITKYLEVNNASKS